MKVRMDKEFVEKHQIERVKEDMAFFKGAYTDGDLKMVLVDAGGYDELYATNVLKMDVEAYDAGWFYDEKTIFTVNAIFDGFETMYKVRFTVDLGLSLFNPDTVQIERYKLAR